MPVEGQVASFSPYESLRRMGAVLHSDDSWGKHVVLCITEDSLTVKDGSTKVCDGFAKCGVLHHTKCCYSLCCYDTNCSLSHFIPLPFHLITSQNSPSLLTPSIHSLTPHTVQSLPPHLTPHRLPLTPFSSQLLSPPHLSLNIHTFTLHPGHT